MNNFDFLFYSNPQPMWIFDVNSLRILEVNPAAIEKYEYTKDEFLNITIRELIPDDEQHRLDKLMPIIQSDSLDTQEFKQISKSKKILHVEIVSFKIAYKGASARLVYANNINEQQLIKNTLKNTQTNLRQILESTSIGFMQTDHNYKVTYWNNAAVNLIGYPKDYILGQILWETFPEIIDTDFYEYFLTSINGGANQEFTSYFWPVQKWFSVYSYHTNDGFTVHFRDITAEKIAEEKLFEKIEQLKEVSYLNSHLIRKPIASLLGLTSLIKDGISNVEDYKQISDYIFTCSQELDDMVKYINLKVNDEDALSGLIYEMTNFSFNLLVDEVVNKLKEQGKQYHFIIECKQEITFYGNKQRITMMLENLLDNAMKFSYKHTNIIIRIEVITKRLVFSVQDFGLGMNNYNLNKLCTDLANIAVRANNTGLYKVAEAVRKHNGSIWVESKKGAGSTFYVQLPFSKLGDIKSYGTPVFSVYHDTGIDIEYDKNNCFITAKWIGFQNLHSIKRSCGKIQDSIITYQCNALLNDNLNVIGTWAESIDWLVQECLPMLEKSGLKFIAWIYSPSTFSRMATDFTIKKMTGEITVKTFTTTNEALKWLAEVSFKVN